MGKSRVFEFHESGTAYGPGASVCLGFICLSEEEYKAAIAAIRSVLEIHTEALVWTVAKEE